MCAALSRYPAIELLCVGVQDASPRVASSAGVKRGHLPSLCLYTKKDVFLLDIEYEAAIGAEEVEGVVSNVLEPFEEILLGNTDVSILRIRQAPQKIHGYATLCQAGAMAMLTQNSSTSEYSLSVFHGIGRQSSMSIARLTTHSFRMEEAVEMNEQIADFCFCKSVELALLSSLTIALLKVSGEVHFATPIVFQGTVVPSQTVTKTLDFLDSALRESDPNTATWRRFRTAKQFFVDAFPLGGGRTNFVTLGQQPVNGKSKSASEVFHWPVQLQGPILAPRDYDELNYDDDVNDYQDFTSADNIEPFGTERDLTGFAIGHLARMVDFTVVSPSSFVPRFKFESSNDAYDLDQELTRGHIVNRVDLSSRNSSFEDNTVEGIRLIPDSMMEKSIHYVTPYQITSISTQSKTSAWNCFDTSSFKGRESRIVGAVISDDAQLGHTLSVRLSNGNMVAINMTETRYLRALENSMPENLLAIQDASSAAASKAENRSLAALEETKPLSNIVKPLMQDVMKGIGSMALIVGTATKQEDVSSDVLAGFVGVESKRRKEIFLPLMTMNEHVTARTAELLSEQSRRKNRLDELKETIASLRERQSVIMEKTDILLQNFRYLVDRSSSVLQSSKSLSPTITQAEYDYFQELKRLDEKTKMWESQVEILSRKNSTLNDDSATTGRDPSSSMIVLSPQHLQNAGQLLNASGHLLKKHEKSLASAAENLDGLAAIVGV